MEQLWIYARQGQTDCCLLLGCSCVFGSGFSIGTSMIGAGRRGVGEHPLTQHQIQHPNMSNPTNPPIEPPIATALPSCSSPGSSLRLGVGVGKGPPVHGVQQFGTQVVPCRTTYFAVGICARSKSVAGSKMTLVGVAATVHVDFHLFQRTSETETVHGGVPSNEGLVATQYNSGYVAVSPAITNVGVETTKSKTLARVSTLHLRRK